MACSGSFPSSRGEKHPDPKSGQDLDPDKPGCTMSCRGNEIDPNFHSLFGGFRSPIPDFCNQPLSRRVGYRVGSSGTNPLINI